MTPIQLLQAQLRYLDEIHKAQLKETIALKEQTEKLTRVIAKGYEKDEIARVKIEDVNMPFMALVGFLVKVALAGIPAGIILGILYAIFVALFGSLLSVIF
jgi:hypothetical protein